MNAAERENFRKAILTVAEANQSRFGLGVPGYKLHVANLGFAEVSEADVRREAEYLAEKGLLAEVTKKVSPENCAWKITAEGRDFLAAGEV